MKKSLTIIDTFGFFFSLYYALSGFKTSKDKPSGMVAGFANFIYGLKEQFKSDYIIFAFDSKGSTFRQELYEDYKANRSTPPPELKEQIPVCIEMVEKMGFASFSKEGYEADDVIASLVRICKKKDIFVRVVTRDKDLYQLIENDKCVIYNPATKSDYDELACVEKFGVKPTQVRDFLAIVGDSSDNIPGVKGVGVKGAKVLLDEFESLEQIYENLPLIRNVKTREKMLEFKNEAFLSQKLASLHDELELDFLLEKADFPSAEPLLNVLEILQEYELFNIIKKLEKGKKKSESLSFEDVLITDENELFDILNSIDKDTIIAFDTETTGLDARSASIVGFSFCFNKNKSYYVPINHDYLGVPSQISNEVAKRAISLIYEHFVVGHNLKYDFKIILQNFGLKIPAKYADTMILAWLYNPSLRVNMDDLAKRLFDYETIKFDDLVKKGQSFADIELKTACKYAAQDAFITLEFYLYFLANLEKPLFEIAQKYEFDFIKVILKMQDEGIRLDTEKLGVLMAEFELKLKALSAEIYDLAGEKFNINSPKQVGEILFERLGLSGAKKTKSGYSTDESVLLNLAKEHKIASKLLDFRELSKLMATYCEPLLKLALNDKIAEFTQAFCKLAQPQDALAQKSQICKISQPMDNTQSPINPAL